jgi:hypothetical protein
MSLRRNDVVIDNAEIRSKLSDDNLENVKTILRFNKNPNPFVVVFIVVLFIVLTAWIYLYVAYWYIDGEWTSSEDITLKVLDYSPLTNSLFITEGMNKKEAVFKSGVILYNDSIGVVKGNKIRWDNGVLWHKVMDS